MNSEQPDRLTILLKAYYTADLEAGRRLEEEILAELAPRIRRQLFAEGFSRADAEDMCQEAQIKIVKGLHKSRADKDPITHILGWTRVIIGCIIKEEIRRNSPQYRMLRDVRYMLEKSALRDRLARWQIAKDWLIGFVQWQDKPFRETPEYAAFCRDDTLFVQQGLENRNSAVAGRVKLPELVWKFLEWVQTPLEERRLIAHLVILRAEMPRVVLSLEKLATDGSEEGLAAPKEPETKLDWERCWQEVCSAPLMSRAAFLLALEPDVLVVLTSAADPRTCIAAALDIASGEMITLWKRLPLQDEEIAHRCNTTANNIQQRRFRLLQRLKGLEEPPPL